MTDQQQQRTRWALDLVDAFVQNWTPLATHDYIVLMSAVQVVNDAIAAIAPKDDGQAHIGWAVFQRVHDADYDRERPSGFVTTQVGAVFETMTQVENVLASCLRKDPTGHYLICEIREIP